MVFVLDADKKPLDMCHPARARPLLRNGKAAVYRVDNIDTWVRRLGRLVPLGSISYENVKFDTQLMQNPDICGK